MRKRLLLVVALLGLACEDIDLFADVSNPDPAGDYTLQKVGGQSLPTTFGNGATVTAGAMKLDESGTYTNSFSVVLGVDTATVNYAGTYSYSHTILVLNQQGLDCQHAGLLLEEGKALRVTECVDETEMFYVK
ncbi:MAG: hypothetical protein OXE96_08470 [Gemmatimonadetes bacterium]|nr:hypothetical protein [Gemmatimonadota bacterium]